MVIVFLPDSDENSEDSQELLENVTFGFEVLLDDEGGNEEATVDLDVQVDHDNVEEVTIGFEVQLDEEDENQDSTTGLNVQAHLDDGDEDDDDDDDDSNADDEGELHRLRYVVLPATHLNIFRTFYSS